MSDNSEAEKTDQDARLAQLVAHATGTFGDQKKADRWLRSCQPRFAGRTPLDIAVTEHGAQLVEEALTQLDEGYFP